MEMMFEVMMGVLVMDFDNRSESEKLRLMNIELLYICVCVLYLPFN